MLSELRVENLGVIEHLDLVLQGGLTVVTGETGAGKTLVVDAIELLIGGRSAGERVRTDAAEARVEGRFVDGDHEMVVARVQPRGGRSRSYVDGRLATGTQLAELGAQRVDLYGQHGHQSLTRRQVQREALDRFAGVDLTPLHEARARLTEVEAELAALGGDERARARELDLLEHQLADIDAARLDDLDEERHLEDEQDRLADAVDHRRAGELALSALRDDSAALDALRTALRAVEARRPFAPVHERLLAAITELDDVVGALHHQIDSIEEDPQRLEGVIARRQRLRDLRRKYGDTLSDVVDFADAARRRRDELASHESRARRLEDQRARAMEHMNRVARQVGDARRAAAPRLAGALTAQLRRLALAHAALGVTVGDSASDPAGDAVAFWFTANPGLDPQPLGRVASGGELSRVMLALRLVLDGGPATLVFDEVDAGIGGAAAEAVADALTEVARQRQVLVVTHLAQVAARAQQHLVVDKQVIDGRTLTTVTPVDGPDRVAEIARMLSGRRDSQRARDHAAELLRWSASSGIDTSSRHSG